MGNVMGKTVNVAAIVNAPINPSVYYYAEEVNTISLYECCPMAREQIEHGTTKDLLVAVKPNTVVIPNIHQGAIKLILEVVNQRAHDKRLRFTATALYSVDTPNKSKHGLDFALTLYNAVGFLVDSSLVPGGLRRLLFELLRLARPKEIDVGKLCAYAHFDRDMVEYGILRVLKLLGKRDKKDLDVLMATCKEHGFGTEAAEMQDAITAERRETKPAQVPRLLQQQQALDKYHRTLAPVWIGKKR